VRNVVSINESGSAVMSKIGLQQSGRREVQAAPDDRQVLDSILQALTGLRFGSIEIVVHEGKITQIERKEKIRL
jgi:hypothetical protein